MTEANQVWVIDDDRSIRWVLEKALTKAGMQVTSFSSANGVMEALERGQPEAVISDVRMPGMDGFALMEKIKATYPELPVIIMTAHSDLDSAVSAYHSGRFRIPAEALRYQGGRRTGAARLQTSTGGTGQCRTRVVARQPRLSVRRRRCRRCFGRSGAWPAPTSRC